MPNRIAVLGWGSLLWDMWADFDCQHDEWKYDGPSLRLEFSRISSTRHSALTLVIDQANGENCTVAYATSKRREPCDAVCDLRSREGTPLKNIRCLHAGDKQTIGDDDTLLRISNWAIQAQFDFVVWTALLSNFREKRVVPFSIEAAIDHIQRLSPEGKASAAEYVWRAPDFVDTPLRRALQVAPWFSDHSAR